MQPVLYLSHGGGPMPLLNDPNHAGLVQAYKDISEKLDKPQAIIVVSAHWEANLYTVSTATNPSMLYDYGGFPPEAYELQYRAPGNVDLAKSIGKSLEEQGLTVEEDSRRGFDHGVFVPLLLLFPEANIPVVMVSLNGNLDPNQHINMGKALARFREQNCLIIGSGMQFLNLPLMFNSNDPSAQKAASEFTDWLDHSLADTNMSEVVRESVLSDWIHAPSARLAHPREEHLLPVHVCYGAAGGPISKNFSFEIFNLPGRCYLWQS
jgi:aromatic ring-opening dioxygenase catalytic subunit (LigB family)